MKPGVFRSACTRFTAVAMLGQAYIRAVVLVPASAKEDGREVTSHPSCEKETRRPSRVAPSLT